MKTIHIHLSHVPARDAANPMPTSSVPGETLQQATARAACAWTRATQRGNKMLSMSVRELEDMIREFEGKGTFAAKAIVAGAKQMRAAKVRMGAARDAGHYGDWEVITSFVRKNKKTGKTQSPYGSAPPDPENWELVKVGYTVRNTRTGIVGIGRQPWATESEAVAWAKAHPNAPRGSPGDSAPARDAAACTCGKRHA